MIMEIDWNHIEKVISGTSYTEEQADKIMRRLEYLEDKEGDFYEEEFYMILQNIEMESSDPLTHGGYYNQTDIKRHLKKLR